MARGNEQRTQVHYQGKDEDFILLIEDAEAVKDWKKDSSIPLAQVVKGWTVFVTGTRGNQGILNAASNATLESEFGTSKEEEVIKAILEKGTVQSYENKERHGHTNDSRGPFLAN